MSRPKNHHYLPQCYLKRFLEESTQLLTVLSLKQGKIFLSGTKNVGCERDFNRCEIDGILSDEMEKIRGQIEGVLAPAIGNVKKSGKFEGADRNAILNLISLLWVSNPYRRKQKNRMIDSLIVMRELYNVLAILGGPVNKAIMYDLQKYIEQNLEKISYTTKTHIYEEYFLEYDTVLKTMFCRKWILLRAPDNETFVCCDNPVVLRRKDNSKAGVAIDFKEKNTQVYFPLSKGFALVGDFEEVDDVICASQEEVAVINSNILSSAQEYVYAHSENICFLSPSDEILHGLMAYHEFFHKKTEEAVVTEEIYELEEVKS